MRFVLVHGWGFHAGIFADFVGHLRGAEVDLVDLGFVAGGPKGASGWPDDAIAVGHSLGLLWLLERGQGHYRALVSIQGFDCFSCHQRGAQKPQGPPEGWAPDLALAHVRLNPEWIVKWIHDPQKLMPGTKMPSFYPGGPPDVLGGDDDAQIRAVRDYVISLGLSDAGASQQAAGVISAGPGAGQ